MHSTKQPFAAAFPGLSEVHVRAGILCPCGRELKASDVIVDASCTALICSGCHRDIVTVERGAKR